MLPTTPDGDINWRVVDATCDHCPPKPFRNLSEAAGSLRKFDMLEFWGFFDWGIRNCRDYHLSLSNFKPYLVIYMPFREAFRQVLG